MNCTFVLLVFFDWTSTKILIATFREVQKKGRRGWHWRKCQMRPTTSQPLALQSWWQYTSKHPGLQNVKQSALSYRSLVIQWFSRVYLHVNILYVSFFCGDDDRTMQELLKEAGLLGKLECFQLEAEKLAEVRWCFLYPLFTFSPLISLVRWVSNTKL